MKHIGLLSIYGAGLFWVCLLLSSCGGEPFTYTPSNEIKSGPGLFSGPDGEFTLVGPDDNETETEKNKSTQKKK